MKNVIDLDLPKYIVNNPVTDQWLAKNLDNNKLEWVRLTPRNSNYKTSFTEKEIREIDPLLMEFSKRRMGIKILKELDIKLDQLEIK